MEDIGLISIIMAAYNAEKTIEFAIDSVLKQTYSNYELIVINDCSCDNTEKIVKSYAEKDNRIKLISNEKNCGVSISRLNGLRAAAGNWIAILDSDDAWKEEKLEKQAEIHEKTKADFIYTATTYIDFNGNSIDWILNVPEKIDYKELLKQNKIHSSSSLIKKDLFEKCYAIGDDMHEDFALFLGVLKNVDFACGVNEPLTIYRVSSDSKSGNKLKSAIMNWRTYRFMDLNIVSSAYYMVWYTVNGILKYKNLK